MNVRSDQAQMRFIPPILCVVGAAALLYGLAEGAGASLPYQDATPELLAHQSAQMHAAWILFRAGAWLLAVGAAWQMLRRSSGSRRSGSED